MPVASSTVHALFPTLVWQTELDAATRAAIEARALAWIDDAMSEVAALGRGESWQSDHALHDDEAFTDLTHIVERSAQAVLSFLKIDYDRIAITGFWANVNAPGAAHRAHHHPNNFMSGVYYLKVPEGAGAIQFHDPRPQSSVMRPPVTELTGENTDQVVVNVNAGTLLLFPAWLMHSVPPNASDERRISVSFNLMFTPYAETMSKPMWEGGRRGTLVG